MKRVHAFVISWRDHDEKAALIARGLDGSVDALTIVHSTPGLDATELSGTWVEVPPDWYFGRKFCACLERFSEDILLLIQADAQSDDWAAVAQRCRRRFEQWPQLSVWAPLIHHTPWSLPAVEVRKFSPDLTLVAQTDAIVWGLDHGTAARLKQLDMSANNLGWGLDWAAISHAYSRQRWVVCDLSIMVKHPRSSGYDHTDAHQQMQDFMAQLEPSELEQYRMLQMYVRLRRHLARPLGSNP